MESAAGKIHGFCTRHCMPLVLCIIFAFCTGVLGSFVGVNLQYPKRNGDLPKPRHVVELLDVLQVRHVRLHEGFDRALLEAFSGSEIELMLAVPNEHIRSHKQAHRWLEENVLDNLPGTRVTAVSFEWNPAISDELLRAMRGLHSSLKTAGLEHDVKVTTSIPVEVFLEEEEDPTRQEHLEYLSDLLQFLQETDSELMVDVNPYDACLESADLPREFFTLETTGKPTFFDLAVHSAYAALRSLGYPNIPVTVGSIGWPWKGENGRLASVENAAVFTENLVKHAFSSSVNVYISEFLDLTSSEGPRYGFYSTSLVPRFRFDISSSTSSEEQIMRRVLADNGTSNGTSTGGTTGGQYCVAKPDAPDNLLASGLNWACGPGNADCSAIQPDGACYLPDTYQSHASYAFNSYYQKNAAAGATCDFQGAAQLTSTDPSHNSCVYTSSSTSGTPSGVNGTGGTSSGGIIQPFNPSGNTSSATRTIAVATWMVGILLWSCWRFLDI